MADITRSYWVEAIQEENVKFVEKIFAALNKETGCDFALNYTQSYIGATLNGKNSHLINVKQGKKGLRISTQVKQTAAIDSTLKSLAIDGDVTYGSDGWYVFFVTNKIDIDKLVSVLKQSAVERGVKPTASKAAAPVATVVEKPTKEKAAKAEKGSNNELDAAKAEIERLKAELAKAKKADKDEDKPAKKSKSNDPFEAEMITIEPGETRRRAFIYEKHIETFSDKRKKPVEHRRPVLIWETLISKCRFQIGKYPITQKQWTAIMDGYNPSKIKGDDMPVTDLSLSEINEFLYRINKLTGKEYRLPSMGERYWAIYQGAGELKQLVLGEVDPTTDNQSMIEPYMWIKDTQHSVETIGKKRPLQNGLSDIWNCEEWVSVNENESLDNEKIINSKENIICIDSVEKIGKNFSTIGGPIQLISTEEFSKRSSSYQLGTRRNHFHFNLSTLFLQSSVINYRLETSGFRLALTID